jgi:hypothetical protein
VRIAPILITVSVVIKTLRRLGHVINATGYAITAREH